MEHSKTLQAESDDCFADFSEFDDPQAAATRAARRVMARSVQIRARVQTRRATAEALLSALLPSRVEDGDSWHVISGGDVDSLSYARHLLAGEALPHMVLSTWCMALEDVHELGRWFDAGQLVRLDAYVGEIFPSQYAEAHTALCDLVRRHAGRVVVFRNHSKVTLLCNPATDRHLVIESSANVNTNPRTEQTAITASRTLHDFYASFFAGVRSFSRNFDPAEATPDGQAA